VNKGIHRLLALSALSFGLALGGSVLAESRPAAPARAPTATASAPAPAAAATDTVNINTADAATLARVLDGIGAAKAEAIVQYREEHGEFVDVYELANVKGVGERTVELNEDRITLKD
jgi:competence ComEA-like helix-hairpin-helix protein